MASTSSKKQAIWDSNIVAARAILDSFVKLDPRKMMGNPVMFVVEVGSVITTILLIRDRRAFQVQPADHALAVVHGAVCQLRRGHGRGPRQGAGGYAAQGALGDDCQPPRRRRTVEQVPSSKLRAATWCWSRPANSSRRDGEIIEGVASVDESAITGESAPVIREAGGDRSAVTGGTRVLSDQIKVKITSNPGETFLDRMIALVEGAERQKTPNEIALNILLAGLTIIFLLAVVTLQPFAIYSGAPQTVFVLVSLLVCLIPTTIGGLLSAIGIAGMDRLIQHNVLAMSGRAVEAAGDVNTLLLDKTGTITLGNRQASEFIPAPGVTESGAGRCGAAFLAGRRDAGRPLDCGAGQGEVRPARPRVGVARAWSSFPSRRRPACRA